MGKINEVLETLEKSEMEETCMGWVKSDGHSVLVPGHEIRKQKRDVHGIGVLG